MHHHLSKLHKKNSKICELNEKLNESIELNLKKLKALDKHLSRSPLPSNDFNLIIPILVVTWADPKITKQFILLRFDSDLAVTENDEKVIIRYCSLILYF